MVCAEPKVWLKGAVNAGSLPYPPPPILVTSVAHREAFRVGRLENLGRVGNGQWFPRRDFSGGLVKYQKVCHIDGGEQWA